MKRMLVGAAAALAIALAGTAWAQSPSDTQTSTDAGQTQAGDPATSQTATGADPYAQESSSLPETASPLALMAAAGVITLAAGAAMIRRRN